MVESVTCDLDLCNSPVSPLCVRPDLHHIVPICEHGNVYVPFTCCVQSAWGVALLPVQYLGIHMYKVYKM